MTEQDWLASTNPRPLLEFAGGKMSQRKLRLFAVACCRRLDELFTEESRQALEVAERLAEGLVDTRGRKRARRNALAAGWVNEPAWLVPHARGPAKQALQCALAEDPLEAATLTLEVTHQSESALRWNREVYENRPRPDTPEWTDLGKRARAANGIALSSPAAPRLRQPVPPVPRAAVLAGRRHPPRRSAVPGCRRRLRAG